MSWKKSRTSEKYGRRGFEPGSQTFVPHGANHCFFLTLFINSRFFTYFFFTWFFFQNKRRILIVGWYRQKYRYATVRRSHALLHFFFFLRLLLCLKFKSLLRCAYVRYFNLCPESLDAKTGQFAAKSTLVMRKWSKTCMLVRCRVLPLIFLSALRTWSRSTSYGVVNIRRRSNDADWFVMYKDSTNLKRFIQTYININLLLQIAANIYYSMINY